jgi:hypothetical protein
MTAFPPPSPTADDPVLTALCVAACHATGATSAWIGALVGDRLRVGAACGSLASTVRGRTVDLGGSAGFVVATGQPMAVAPRPGDRHVVAGVLGSSGIVPTSLCALACLDDGEPAGVLELVDKAGGGRFGFDDVELAALLASIAGPALATRIAPLQPPPAEALAAQLHALAADDHARYAPVAWVVQRLLSSV